MFFVCVKSVDGIQRNVWHPMKQHDTNGCYKVRRINQVTRNTWTTVPRHSHINRSHIKHKNTIHRHRLSHHGSYIKPNRSFCPNWKRATKHAQAINCIRIGQKVIKRWSPLRTFNICQITLAEQPQHSKKRIQFEFSSNLSKHSKPKKKNLLLLIYHRIYLFCLSSLLYANWTQFIQMNRK